MHKNKSTTPLTSQDKIEYSEEIDSLIKTYDELMEVRKEYAEMLAREKFLSKSVEELKNRLYPSVYFSTSKHHTTKEPYIIARSMWKKGVSDYDQLSAYVGPIKRFEKGIEDPEVLKIGTEKIRQSIRKKYPL